MADHGKPATISRHPRLRRGGEKGLPRPLPVINAFVTHVIYCRY